MEKINPNDFTELKDVIHVELKWKLEKLVKIINSHKIDKNTTFTSILNDCIAIGIRESDYAEQLEFEYNDSSEFSSIKVVKTNET